MRGVGDGRPLAGSVREGLGHLQGFILQLVLQPAVEGWVGVVKTDGRRAHLTVVTLTSATDAMTRMSVGQVAVAAVVVMTGEELLAVGEHSNSVSLFGEEGMEHGGHLVRVGVEVHALVLP